MVIDGTLAPESLTEAPLRAEKGRFAPGHKRLYASAEPKAKTVRTWDARRIMEEYGFNPIHFLIRVATEGKIPGTNQKVNVEERIRAAKELTKYGFPTLSATQITGRDDGPVRIATLDVTKIMMNPELAAHAQALSLGASMADDAYQLEEGAEDSEER